MQSKIRIAVEVLNGSTGECREIVANVKANSEIEAVNLLFARARKDDYCYRFLGAHGVIEPVNQSAVAVEHQNQTYWALEA